MGSYLNPGNEKFAQCINSEIYIDKSGLIRYCSRVMNSLQKYISMSRPRRFGKSVTADMLTAYYSRGCDSAALFASLGIVQNELYHKHLNQHNVIRLDIQQFLFQESHLDIFIDKIQEAVAKELRMEFGDCFDVDE